MLCLDLIIQTIIIKENLWDHRILELLDPDDKLFNLESSRAYSLKEMIDEVQVIRSVYGDKFVAK
jgi:hypothetical protein